MACGIYLELDIEAGADKRLAAALAAARVACVLLRAKAGENIDLKLARQLVEIGQSHQCAMLIGGDTKLARKLAADGVHLDWSPSLMDEYGLARETLGSDAIVGADAGRLRHDAMLLGEAGADYIGFRPAETRLEENRQALREERLSLLAWWAEVAEVPCVAFEVDSVAEAAALAAAGADFVGLSIHYDGEAAANFAALIRAIGTMQPASTVAGARS